MEFEFWWLLAFPLFFGLGWLAARIDIKHLVSESRALPRSYFKGLNFLLNEQPDKAIEAFIEVVKVDPETIELHFALGSLFRRRGETERAIRMHQNLLERGDLGEEQRLAALFELGQDYLKAGLLDRAEEVFVKLRDTAARGAALKCLLDIYQQEKDWEKAIGVASELERRPGPAVEQGDRQLLLRAGGRSRSRTRAPKRRVAHLEQALEANRKCARANVLLGDFDAAAGDHAAAIEAWKRIEQQNPAYLALVAQRLLESYRVLGKQEEGLTLLRGFLASYPSLDLLDVAFQSTLEAQGAGGGVQAGARRIAPQPDPARPGPAARGANCWWCRPERRGDVQLVKNLVHSHTLRLARYRCENCGFKARQFYWHCPACGGWETYPPRRTRGI